jgi:D-serine deaminase-like pyridoxal phosphate-dependent protein
MPRIDDVPGATYVRASDEHGVITLAEGTDLPLGSKLRLVPGHCDPTVNLYDWLVCHRNGRVEDIWPIAARGAFY